MIEEALSKLEAMSIAGMKPLKMDFDNHDPSTRYIWNPKEGMVEAFPLAPPSRRHNVTTLASLAGAYKRYTPAFTPSVWVSLASVIVVLDDEADAVSDGEEEASGEVGDDFRQHSITLPVSPSPLFKTLTNIPRSQKDLVLCLRHDLKPSEIVPENFEATISRLTFSTTATATGEYGTIKNTLGTTKDSEVKAQADIPPELSVRFEPFPALADQMPGTVVVECSVVVDPEAKTITVRPYPGQIELAQAQAVEMLRAKLMALLEADETVVFAGTP